jgi:hypothetical protein
MKRLAGMTSWVLGSLAILLVVLSMVLANTSAYGQVPAPSLNCSQCTGVSVQDINGNVINTHCSPYNPAMVIVGGVCYTYYGGTTFGDAHCVPAQSMPPAPPNNFCIAQCTCTVQREGMIDYCVCRLP